MEEVADVVVILVKNGYITRQTTRVNGDWYIGNPWSFCTQPAADDIRLPPSEAPATVVAHSPSRGWHRRGGGHGPHLSAFTSPSMLWWNLSLSKAIAAEVAIFNSFVGNELWTFRGLGGGGNRLPQRLARLLKFNLICLAGIVWSVGLLNVEVYWLGLNVYLANFIAIVLVSLWNFFVNLRFGWNMPAKCGH